MSELKVFKVPGQYDVRVERLFTHGRAMLVELTILAAPPGHTIGETVVYASTNIGAIQEMLAALMGCESCLVDEQDLKAACADQPHKGKQIHIGVSQHYSRLGPYHSYKVRAL